MVMRLCEGTMCCIFRLEGEKALRAILRSTGPIRSDQSGM